MAMTGSIPALAQALAVCGKGGGACGATARLFLGHTETLFRWCHEVRICHEEADYGGDAASVRQANPIWVA